MGLCFRLAAVKGLRKKRRKKKVEGGRKNRNMAIVKSDSRSVTFGEIPEELLVEILARLPANSLMKFKCVSKFWCSLICSRYFTNLFFQVSSPKQERLMFMSLSVSDKENNLLLSSSPNNFWDNEVFTVINQDITLPGTRGGYFVNALRGLMCFRLGQEVRIYNPTTSQLLNLPQVKYQVLGDMWNYFGHNPVDDEYKVLSIVSSVSKEHRVTSEAQVLVLGAGASWRNTRSPAPPPPPHRPYSQGVSINCVLYYGAWIDKNKCVVMSFDLTSEEFNLIELPTEASIFWHLRRANLMNYRGKLAVFEISRLMTECILDLWVVEDAGQSKWSHRPFVLPSHQLMQSHGYDELLVHSTTRSGQVRLSDGSFRTWANPLHSIYDLDESRIREGVVLGPLDPRFTETASLQTTLWEDVKSIMYLQV